LLFGIRIAFQRFRLYFFCFIRKKSELYEKIILLLSENNFEQTQLAELLSIQTGSETSSYLDELVVSGFIDRDYTWHIKTGNISKLSKYRLSDNYLRFYLKYIKPNIQKIRNDQFKNHSFI